MDSNLKEKAQQELQNLKLYYDALLSALEPGILVTDSGDTIITENEKVAKFFDLSGNLVGKKLQDTELWQRCPELKQRLQESRAGQPNTVRFECGISSSITVAITIKPILSQSQTGQVGTLIYVENVAPRFTLQGAIGDLQGTAQELQTANEELETTNEELQSTNEELQSTNEELETSKEELQSVNEELATVNSELQAKVADLSRANNDMNNLLAGTGVGTVFVDHQLCIQRFTPAVTQLINLIRSDIGRPLAHIVNNLQGYDRLVLDVQDVLDTLTPKEVEVQTHAGAWHLLRIRPYRTLENVIEGAVITFLEVTEQRRAQTVLLEHESLRRMAAVMRDAGDAITVQGLDGRILAWNRTAVRRYGYSEAEALGMNIRRLFPDDQREAALAVIARLIRAEVLEPYRTKRLTKDGKVVAISLIASALLNESGQVYAVFTTERETKGEADGRED
jgi:PAS domain S-box-containing protein